MRATDWVEYYDEYGNKHTDWFTDPNINSQAAAQGWAKSQGKDANGNQKITGVKYIGKTGMVERGYTDENGKVQPYILNADGTATDANGNSTGKPSRTKQDEGNGEPNGEGDPSNPKREAAKSAFDMGGVGAALAEVGGDIGRNAAGRVMENSSNLAEALRASRGVEMGYNVMKGADLAGKLFGGAHALIAGVELYETIKNPNSTTEQKIGGFINFGVKVALTFARINPLVNLGISILDAVGVTLDTSKW